MTCEDCPFYEGCIERRGLCRDYLKYMERVERVRQDIERINENQKTVARCPVPDKGGGHRQG